MFLDNENESKYVKLLPEEFETWRDELADKYLSKCDKNYTLKGFYGYNSRTRSGEKILDLITLPKALVTVTRQMCECDEECTQNSLAKMKFPDCEYYDWDNSKKDEKFYRNILVPKRVIDGKLTDKRFFIDHEKVNSELSQLLEELCEGNDKSLEKLTCKAFELHDECWHNRGCLQESASEILPENIDHCLNRKILEELRNIDDKMGNPWIFARYSRAIEKRAIEDSPPATNSASTISSIAGMSLPLTVLGLTYFPNIRNIGSRKLGLLCVAMALTFMKTYEFE